MTEQQQQIAIAEACGCSLTKDDAGFWLFKTPGSLDKRVASHYQEVDAWRLCAPGYLNDLNAMHEAVNTLNEIQGCIFCDNLFKIMNSSDGVSEFMKVNASAAQRAEAFLKTLNLWKP